MSFNDLELKDVPKCLSRNILQNSNSYIEPPLQKVVLKYLVIFFVSIFFSLVICPQNGVGFLRDNYPIYHTIFHNNMLLCGLYCGLIFFTTTHLISFYFLNHFEKIVLFKKIGYMPSLAMSLFFLFSMTPIFSIVNFSALYSTGWIGITIFAVLLHRKMFTKKFQLELS